MNVISTNIGKKKEVDWKGKQVLTGIFKSPIVEPIFLGKHDVDKDDVIDRRFHGGIDKAVYAYNSDQYPFWKNKYPEINHDFGMLGENLSIEKLDENEIRIGSIYKLGQALVQVSQPRQPCFKLGIRFNNQSVLKEMIQSGYSGIYFRVLEEGFVQVGDSLELIEEFLEEPTVLQCHQVVFKKTNDKPTIERVQNSKFLAKSYLN